MKLFVGTSDYTFREFGKFFGTIVPWDAYQDRPHIDFKYLSTFDTSLGVVEVFTN